MNAQLCISDNAQDMLHIVDLGSMQLRTSTAVGAGPYPADLIRPDLVLVSTRGEATASPVQVVDGAALPKICLSHKPRSTTKHPTKPLALVGGADKALTTVLDTGALAVVTSVGSGRSDSRRDFGGGLACGHPAWGPEDTIIHLDRIERRIELYEIGKPERIASINLPTSAHHVTRMGSDYLVLCEGNPTSRIAPSVARVQITGQSLAIAAHRFLPVPRLQQSRSGGHHLTYDSHRDRVYVGTNDGRLYTLQGPNLDVVNFFDAGPGCGHVTLCADIGLAVTTNHTGPLMTVFDLDAGAVTGSIAVSGPSSGGKKTQGHTSKWFSDSSRLITTAAQEGRVLEIDPTSRTITREVSVQGGYLIQGCFAEVDNGS